MYVHVYAHGRERISLVANEMKYENAARHRHAELFLQFPPQSPMSPSLPRSLVLSLDVSIRIPGSAAATSSTFLASCGGR